ncbi:LysR family transcriptional regulator [Glacieibacterium frigidum]|uniref:LysR family transcriptional regulator n=1 Tax=Glacieibacterium frigidum TaxID=2593303 RepID=A0A552UEX9_9SPHN|nr:LysR family transcriptional regulator [Glacieibacterium frigidum]TRW16787.1 LysR family transcriptional regulator [Glacieibacterium frigidum]
MDLLALNLRHLRAVTQVAALGRIGAAAQSINLSQPAVTQALTKVEAAVGLSLFERRPDGMAGTAAADLLVPRIEAALHHIGNPRVTMSQMRALIALADAGSYVDGARNGGVTQPSLHRAIGDLSLAVGRPLVERRGRGIGLTAAGRRTVRAFRLARAELVAAASELAVLNGRETGRITIGAMPLSRARLLPAAATAFHRSHPQVEVRIVEGSHAELIEPLRDGEIDLLIGALRAPVAGSDIDQRPLLVDRPVIIGRVGHPLAGRAGVTADVLAEFDWTIAAPGTPLRTLWQRMFDAAGVAAPPVPIECGSVITIRQILLDSDFLTLLSPDQVAAELAAGWLVKISDTPGELARTIGVTTRAGWRPTALQSAFLAALDAAAGK